MSQTRRHVQAYLGSAEYSQLEREAVARRSTISKCIADCLGEYFALRTELATAIETPGQAGEPHQGAIIHSLLARSEERVVATLDRRTTEVLGDLRRLQTMLDRLVFTYLAHTPEVPGDLCESAITSANRRYANYRAVVNDQLASDQPPAAAETSR